MLKRLDWLSILFYLLLVTFGLINIYSTTIAETKASILDLNTLYGKQLFFFILSIFVAGVIFFIEVLLFERFASILYLISIVLLIGLFPFGKTIAGATSWYDLLFFNFQPSEFAKLTTCLALAKYLGDIQTDIKEKKHQAYSLLIIFAPVLLIFPQPDPGSALVFTALLFVLFREGFPLSYVFYGLTAVMVFVFTLKYGTIWVSIGLGILISVFYLFKTNRIKIKTISLILFLGGCLLTSISVRLVFDHVFQQRHRDRFSLWLGLEDDPNKLQEIKKTIGYNTDQAEKAIESGGFLGKGFLQGTLTKGDFVPAQHTDYIFSSVGEEWGFFGTSLVIIIFSLFFLRLIFLAERQKKNFSRMYGYGIISVLFIHYLVNVGMVIGLVPTVGIPLPFFSYGGSGLFFFSVMLFIFLKLDADRLHERV